MLKETHTIWLKRYQPIRWRRFSINRSFVRQLANHIVIDTEKSQLKRLPDSPARTRFAPSPTGYLHLGSLRTALYSYLLAKATGGQFLLRIEDTDQTRTVPGAEDRICRDLEWAGLQWDEGPETGGPNGPYKQSERTQIYTKHAHQLLDRGHAYKCFCTPERLATLAEQRNQLGLPPDYDRTCAGLTEEEIKSREGNGEKHVIRLRVPDALPQYTDLIYGVVGKRKSQKPLYKAGERFYEDPVMLKSDGRPTYHLANVIDDHLMNITHVIRGIEWAPSTPKHIVLYNAFGWEPPRFAHVGLLLDKDRRKLSKRNMDIDIRLYQEAGIFPEAVVNYAALLGWSHNLGSDYLPLPELVKNFTLKFTKGNSVVDSGKLMYLQKLYAKDFIQAGGVKLDGIVTEIESLVRGQYEDTVNLDIDYSKLRAYITKVLRATAEHYTNSQDFFRRHLYFFRTPARPLWADKARSPLHKEDHDFANAVQKLDEISQKDWNETALIVKVRSITETMHEQKINSSNFADVSRRVSGTLRTILLGGNSGPTMVNTMVLLGREVTLKRIASATMDEHVDE